MLTVEHTGCPWRQGAVINSEALADARLDDHRSQAKEETYDEHAIGANFVCRWHDHRGARKRRTAPSAFLPALKSGSSCAHSASDATNAMVVQIASAKDASGKRTYWAMVIAGDYKPKPGKGKRDMEPLVAVKREAAPSGRPKSSDCHIKVSAFAFEAEREVGSAVG